MLKQPDSFATTADGYGLLANAIATRNEVSSAGF